jgi:diacylglycerol kinase family enzyme
MKQFRNGWRECNNVKKETIESEMEAETKRKHLFIINPKSFPLRQDMFRIRAQIEKYFKKKPGQDYTIHISRYPRDAVGIVRKRIGQIGPAQILRVYALGGDGIIFDCLNGLMGAPNVELAPMPYGTGSDFVRAFGDNHYTQFRDIELQATSPVIPTDVIHCGNNCALNCCTVGLEAASVIRTLSLDRRFEKVRFRFSALNGLFYTIGGIGAVFDQDVMGQYYGIEADGEDRSGFYSLINIANGPCYGSGMSPVITAVPDDGELDMMVARKVGSLKALQLISDYLKGRYYKHPSICTLRRVQKVSIRSESPLLVNLDGEVFFDSELIIEIIPKAVKIVAVNNLTYRRRAEYRESNHSGK